MLFVGVSEVAEQGRTLESTNGFRHAKNANCRRFFRREPRLKPRSSSSNYSRCMAPRLTPPIPPPLSSSGTGSRVRRCIHIGPSRQGRARYSRWAWTITPTLIAETFCYCSTYAPCSLHRMRIEPLLPWPSSYDPTAKAQPQCDVHAGTKPNIAEGTATIPCKEKSGPKLEIITFEPLASVVLRWDGCVTCGKGQRGVMCPHRSGACIRRSHRALSLSLVQPTVTPSVLHLGLRRRHDHIHIRHRHKPTL